MLFLKLVIYVWVIIGWSYLFYVFYENISPIFFVWVVYWAIHFSLSIVFFPEYPPLVMQFLTVGPILLIQILGLSRRGLINYKIFFNWLYNAVKAHHYCPVTFYTLFLIFSVFQDQYKNKEFFRNKNILVDLLALSSAIIVFLLLILKELFKRGFFLLFIGGLFKISTDLTYIFYVVQIFYFICIVSSLSLNEELVLFIAPYFGPFFFGWIGCYQPIKIFKNNKFSLFIYPQLLKLNKEKSEIEYLKEILAFLKKITIINFIKKNKKK